MMQTDSLIVGGGIIGLLTARELAQVGKRVTIIDAQAFGQEASWAGGGIVSPLYPWRYSEPVTALASWAQDFYPRLATSLAQETGIDPQWQASGLLMLDAEDSAQALTWAKHQQKPLQVLDTQQLRHYVDSHAFHEGLWMPQVGHIRNPRLLKALMLSLKQAGVECKPHCPLLKLLLKNHGTQTHCLGGHTPEGNLYAEETIICTGAWTQKLLANITPLNIQPVKGQMLMFKPQQSCLKTMLLHRGHYLIPRKSGEIIVGSTLEPKGFHKLPTQAAFQQLHQAAIQLLPTLKTAEMIAQWTGLRPGSTKGIPYISAVPNYTGLYVNAGHFRNGLVLAPAAARLMADIVLQRSPITDPFAYRIIRN